MFFFEIKLILDKNLKNKEEKIDETKINDALSKVYVTKNENDLKVDEDEISSGDENDDENVTGIPKEALRDEFVTIMEQRFLNGKDAKFYDYSSIDNGTTTLIQQQRIYEQDMEDAYFSEN